jgi:hypothetical protein
MIKALLAIGKYDPKSKNQAQLWLGLAGCVLRVVLTKALRPEHLTEVNAHLAAIRGRCREEDTQSVVFVNPKAHTTDQDNMIDGKWALIQETSIFRMLHALLNYKLTGKLAVDWDNVPAPALNFSPLAWLEQIAMPSTDHAAENERSKEAYIFASVLCQLYATPMPAKTMAGHDFTWMNMKTQVIIQSALLFGHKAEIGAKHMLLALPGTNLKTASQERALDVPTLNWTNKAAHYMEIVDNEFKKDEVIKIEDLAAAKGSNVVKGCYHLKRSEHDVKTRAYLAPIEIDLYKVKLAAFDHCYRQGRDGDKPHKINKKLLKLAIAHPSMVKNGQAKSFPDIFAVESTDAYTFGYTICDENNAPGIFMWTCMFPGASAVTAKFKDKRVPDADLWTMAESRLPMYRGLGQVSNISEKKHTKSILRAYLLGVYSIQPVHEELTVGEKIGQEPLDTFRCMVLVLTKTTPIKTEGANRLLATGEAKYTARIIEQSWRGIETFVPNDQVRDKADVDPIREKKKTTVVPNASAEEKKKTTTVVPSVKKTTFWQPGERTSGFTSSRDSLAASIFRQSELQTETKTLQAEEYPYPFLYLNAKLRKQAINKKDTAPRRSVTEEGALVVIEMVKTVVSDANGAHAMAKGNIERTSGQCVLPFLNGKAFGKGFSGIAKTVEKSQEQEKMQDIDDEDLDQKASKDEGGDNGWSERDMYKTVAATIPDVKISISTNASSTSSTTSATVSSTGPIAVTFQTTTHKRKELASGSLTSRLLKLLKRQKTEPKTRVLVHLKHANEQAPVPVKQ